MKFHKSFSSKYVEHIFTALTALILKNRRFSIICANIVYQSIPNVFCKIGFFSTLKTRAYIGSASLKLESNKRSIRQLFLAKDLAFFKCNPDAFLCLGYLLEDKKLLTDDYNQAFMELNINNEVPSYKPLQLFMFKHFKATKLNPKNFVSFLTQSESIKGAHDELFDIFRSQKPSFQNEVIFQLKSFEEKESLKYLQALSNYDSHELAKINASKSIKYYLGENVVLENAMVAYFLTGDFVRCFNLLEIAIEHLKSSSKEGVQQLEWTKQYIQLGLLAYRFGCLMQFQRKVSLDISGSESRLLNISLFNLYFVNKGPISAYHFLRRPLDTVLLNFKSLNYKIDLTNKNNETVLILSNVNALCNQFMFSFFFSALEQEAKKFIISVDSRLVKILARSFPKLEFYGFNKVAAINSKFPHSQRMVINDELLKLSESVDYASAMPVERYLKTEADFQRFRVKGGWLITNDLIKKRLENELGALPGIKVGVSIGSGVVSYSRLIYRVTHGDLKELANLPNVSLVNLDYQYTQQELQSLASDYGVHLYQPSFDLKNELDSVLALISCLDLVITTPNSFMDMCASVGTKAFVFDFTSQMKAWEIADDKGYLYSADVRFFRPNYQSNDIKKQVINNMADMIIQEFKI